MQDRFFQHRFEFVTALGVLLWGAWLLNPFVDTFVRYVNVYAEMSKHATENQWGAGALVIGITGLFGLLRDNKHMRRASMLGALAFRAFTLMFVGLQTNFTANGVPDILLWTSIAMTAYIRIDRDP